MHYLHPIQIPIIGCLCFLSDSAESLLHTEELEREVKELRKTLEVAEAVSTRKYEALHQECSKLTVTREIWFTLISVCGGYCDNQPNEGEHLILVSFVCLLLWYLIMRLGQAWETDILDWARNLDLGSHCTWKCCQGYSGDQPSSSRCDTLFLASAGADRRKRMSGGARNTPKVWWTSGSDGQGC